MHKGLSKEKQKWVAGLKLKKNRQATGQFIVEGVKIVQEVLNYKGDAFEVEALFATPEWWAVPEQSAWGEACTRWPVEVSPAELGRLSDLHTPNQVLTVLKRKTIPGEQPRVGDSGFYLVLDAIQDPGNLGTLLRIADWFGAAALVCGKGCADWCNPKVLQASMGSFLRVPVWDDIDLPAWLPAQAQRLPVYGAALDGENVWKVPVGRNALLVIGNESQGLSPEVLARIDRRIAIPRYGGAESLNAAAAAAALAAIFVR